MDTTSEDRQSIRFRDLGFAREFRRFVTHDGRHVHRWTPIGVPRIPAKFENCVFFLFGPKTSKVDETIGPGGTGFIVCRHSETLGSQRHMYAITNKHVINNYYWIRINTADGGTRIIKHDPDDWAESADEDLAALDITDDIDLTGEDHVSWIWNNDFLNHDSVWGNQIGIGDQVFMIGLFSNHSGGGRNIPVARFGNIAAMPSTLSPVMLSENDPYIRPAFLNDMRSRSGFSGAPVWVWRTPADDLEFYSSSPMQKQGMPLGRSFLCFAGIHRAQFPEETTFLESESPQVLRRGAKVRIASSMTVVIPAWEITRLLEGEKLRCQREARDARPERIASAASAVRFSSSLE
jgi:hypothetical protein